MPNDNKINVGINDGTPLALVMARRGSLPRAIRLLNATRVRLENNMPLTPTMTEYLVTSFQEILAGVYTDGEEGLGNANKALLLKPPAKQKRRCDPESLSRDIEIAIEVQIERELFNNHHTGKGGSMWNVSQHHPLGPSAVRERYNKLASSESGLKFLVESARHRIKRAKSGSEE